MSETFPQVSPARQIWRIPNEGRTRMVDYGFVAGQDFSEISDKPKGAGRPRIDHIISLNMAKEISMIQRTDKGLTHFRRWINVDTRMV